MGYIVRSRWDAMGCEGINAAGKIFRDPEEMCEAFQGISPSFSGGMAGRLGQSIIEQIGAIRG